MNKEIKELSNVLEESPQEVKHITERHTKGGKGFWHIEVSTQDGMICIPDIAEDVAFEEGLIFFSYKGNAIQLIEVDKDGE